MSKVRDVSPILFFFGDNELFGNTVEEEGEAKTVSPITFLTPRQSEENFAPPAAEKVEDESTTDDGPKGVTHPATRNVSGTTPEQSASSAEIVPENAGTESQSDFNPSF